MLMNINYGNIEEISLQKQNTTLKISTGFRIKRIKTEFCFVSMTESLR